MLSISSGFDEAELEAVLKKMDGDRAEHDQKLERQAQLLDTRAAKIRKLEGIYSSSLLLPETGSDRDSLA